MGTGVSTVFAVHADRARKREHDAVQRHQELRRQFMTFWASRDPQFRGLSKAERNCRFDGLVEEFLAQSGTDAVTFQDALASAGEGGTSPASAFSHGFFGD